MAPDDDDDSSSHRGPSSVAASEIFCREQSPSYLDGELSAFFTQNLHDADNGDESDGDGRRSRHLFFSSPASLLRPAPPPPPPPPSAAAAATAASDGMLQHHVEMLVVILRDDGAWKDLQRRLREDMYSGSESGTTHMAVRHRLDGLLREGFRSAAERQHRQRHQSRRGESGAASPAPLEQTGEKPHRKNVDGGNDDDDDADETGTLETASSHSLEEEDDEALVEEGSGEFLMGGRIGDGSFLVEPISYKDVDLLRHPRSQILGRGGDGPSPRGTASVRLDRCGRPDHLRGSRCSVDGDAVPASSFRPRPSPQVSFV